MEPKLLMSFLKEEYRCSVQSIYSKLSKLGIEKNLVGRTSYLNHSQARQLFKSKWESFDAPQTYCWHNNKGGVGKTTINREFSIRINSLGGRVLIIDADPQCNTTNSFGIDDQSSKTKSLTNILKGEVNIKDAIVKISEGLHVLPANIESFLFDDLISDKDRKTLFKEMLAPIEKDYDVITFDTPPGNTRIVIALLAYVETAVIPLIPDDFSIKALKMVITRIMQIDKINNNSTNIKILINRYDRRISESQVLFDSIHASEDIIHMCIKSQVRVDQNIFHARKEGSSIYESLNQSRIRACEDIDFMVRELIGF